MDTGSQLSVAGEKYSILDIESLVICDTSSIFYQILIKEFDTGSLVANSQDETVKSGESQEDSKSLRNEKFTTIKLCRSTSVKVVLFFNIHGKHLWSCWDGQLTLPHFSWAGLDLLSG